MLNDHDSDVTSEIICWHITHNRNKDTREYQLEWFNISIVYHSAHDNDIHMMNQDRANDIQDKKKLHRNI